MRDLKISIVIMFAVANIIAFIYGANTRERGGNWLSDNRPWDACTFRNINYIIPGEYYGCLSAPKIKEACDWLKQEAK